ncbi:MAG: hypothetical protein Q7S48_02965 [bacterium]|nr:hypothetical protein [bacterium]
MTRLDTRKEQLLAAVVREHAKTAQPVASDAMKEKAGLDVSGATIRNEMLALEKAGYLRQRHTSAGRVPTEAGYRYYVTHCLEEQNVREEMGQMQSAVSPAQEYETRLKQLARELAGEMREGVFIGFTPQSSYYTGLSYLFEQPEFESVDFVRHMGDIVDNLDRIVAELFEDEALGVQVYVGSENPFGAQCGTVLLRAGTDRAMTMMGVLGPMRMDYDRVIGMMKELEQIL